MLQLEFGIGGDSLSELNEEREKLLQNLHSSNNYSRIQGQIKYDNQIYDCVGFFDFNQKEAIYLIDSVFKENELLHYYRTPVLVQNTSNSKLLKILMQNSILSVKKR